MDDPFIREHIEGECERDSGPVQDEAGGAGGGLLLTVASCVFCHRAPEEHQNSSTN